MEHQKLWIRWRRINRQVMPKRRTTVRINSKLIVEEDMQRKTSYQQGRLFEPKMLTKEVTIRWRTSKDVDWDSEMKKRDRLAWSSDWPKEWLFSVQSSSTTTLMDRSSTMDQGYTQTTLEEGWCPSLWIDTHLLEMKMKTNNGFKRWPSVKSKDDLVSSQKIT
jgi:hypothetical protein